MKEGIPEEGFPIVPIVNFKKGNLTMEGSNREQISSDEKIKSLKIFI